MKIRDIEIKFRIDSQQNSYVKWIGGESLLLCQSDQTMYIPVDQNMDNLLLLKEKIALLLEALVKSSALKE